MTKEADEMCEEESQCGHQPAVILVKLMFGRGAVQRFLLRTLYPVFHTQ